MTEPFVPGDDDAPPSSDSSPGVVQAPFWVGGGITVAKCSCGHTFSYSAMMPKPCPACGKTPEHVVKGLPFIKGRGNTAHDHAWREVQTHVPGAIKQLCTRCGLETFEDARRASMSIACVPRELAPDQKDALAAAVSSWPATASMASDGLERRAIGEYQLVQAKLVLACLVVTPAVIIAGIAVYAVLRWLGGR